MSASFQSLQNCNTKAPISWEQFNSSILKFKKKNCENDVNLKKISEVILPFSLHFLLPFVTFLWPISHLPITISNHISVIWCKWLCLCTQKNWFLESLFFFPNKSKMHKNYHFNFIDPMPFGNQSIFKYWQFLLRTYGLSYGSILIGSTL